jgi:2-hydroxycyclohexanecarboxyl-CoA dehydrogenase
MGIGHDARVAPNEVAVVTGGAQGIGAAIVEALAADGFSVAVCDIDDGGATDTAVRVAASYSVPVRGFAVDVTDRSSVRDAIGRIEADLGPILALVNNAGVDVVKPFVESTTEEWQRILAVNLVGTITCCHAVLDSLMHRKRGRIVNVASNAGRVGSSGEAVYSASKGGVIAFTKALAREAARNNITVNCVCPGPTETSLLAQLAEYSQKLYDGLARAIPLGRTAQPADIAPAVAFLVSPGGGYITGQTLSVSGGLTMA